MAMARLKNKWNFNLRPLAILIESCLLLTATPAYAESVFNVNFLSSDVKNVADLSSFANGKQQLPGTYHVDIWRNNEFVTTSDLQFFAAKNPQPESVRSTSGGLEPCLNKKWLERLGVNMKAFPELLKEKQGECIDVGKYIPGTELALNFNKLRLDISLPQVSLHNNARGYIPADQWDDGINALLINYSLSGDKGNLSENYYLNLMSGFNYGPWRLRNTRSWSDSPGSVRSKAGWKTISTSLERGFSSIKSHLLIGDGNSSSDVYDSVGFRGSRLASSDSMYPDSLRGYAPTVRGIATSHAKVTIRQNGYVIYQSYVTPGAFEITDLNPTSASGDLDVMVEEQDGSRKHYLVPYSTVPVLQREGRVKYDLVTGEYRSGDSSKSRPFFLQGTLIGGLGYGATLYAGTQLAKNYRAYTLGIGDNFGDFGAISLDLTNAQSELVDGTQHTGQSLRFLYSKSLNNLGTNFQLLGYRYSTSEFYSFSDTTWKKIAGYEYETGENGEQRIASSYHNLRFNKRGRLQANISQSLGDLGSFYVAGSQQSYWGTSQTDAWYQMGYAGAWQGLSYSLAWQWSKSVGLSKENRTLTFNLSVPFSVLNGHGLSASSPLDNAYSTLMTSRDSSGKNTSQLGIGGTLLKDQSLSYSLSQGHTSGAGYSGSVNGHLQGRYTNIGLGYNYDRTQHDLNFQLSGGVIAHDDGITFSQPLGDTNVLIKAPGAQGVSVENESGIKTDWRGYAVVPYATVYRYNRVALDTNSMDSHTDISNTVSTVVPTEGALVRAEFDAHIGIRAILTLKHNGKSVPFGATVAENDSGSTGLVDEDSQVYLSGMPLSGTLVVQWGSSAAEQCSAQYAFKQQALQQAISRMTLKCQ